MGNKTIVCVTGDADPRGVGHGISQSFLNRKDQYQVLGMDILYDRFLIDEEKSHISIPGDITKEPDVTGYFNYVSYLSTQQNNAPIILINNAATHGMSWFKDMSMSELRRVMEVNFFGTTLMCQKFLEIAPDHSVIINISSVASSIPMRCSYAYNCSKAAVDMITLNLAREYAERDIAVFAIKLGRVEGTTMAGYLMDSVKELRGWTESDALKYEQSYIHMHRRIEPREVGTMIVNLLDTPDPMIWTGSIIPFCGGQR